MQSEADKDQISEEVKHDKGKGTSPEVSGGPETSLDSDKGEVVAPREEKKDIDVKVQLAEAHTRVYDAFSRAFNRQNSQFEKAIRSLDSLNEQISEFFNTEPDTKSDDDHKQRLILAPCVTLMKKLLLDAQGKFRKMMEENQQLAERIDGELQTAHKEVDILRRDLADTNRRIAEMQIENTAHTHGQRAGQLTGGFIDFPNSYHHLTNGIDDKEKRRSRLEDQIDTLGEENGLLKEKNNILLRELEELRYLRNVILKSGECGETNGGDDGEGRNKVDVKIDPRMSNLALELTHAKEALSALKADRKRLKTEKFDLLNQMKQLYATLEDKERELREFLRTYEQRMKESDESLRQIVNERDESEREKWNLLKHARNESERAVALAAQLNQKDMALRRLEEDIEVMRKQLSTFAYGSDGDSIKTNGPSHLVISTPTSSPLPFSISTLSASTPTYSPLPTICTSATNGRGSSADSGVRLSSDRESTASQEGGPGTPNKEGYSNIYANPAMLLDNRLSFSRSEDTGTQDSRNDTENSSCTTPVNGIDDSSHIPSVSSGSSGVGEMVGKSSEQMCETEEELNASGAKKNGPSMTLTRKGHKGAGGTWGSISRVFTRQKKRAALESTVFDGNASDKRASWSPGTSFSVPPLTEESYAEKIRLLKEAQHIPLERWKAQTVLAWLEITLGMPQYGPMCAENVRSGKVLLELSDSELESGLGINHILHRKKVRLAIEELRDPRRRRFPKISALDNTWVLSEWLLDIGLPQYAESFASNIVDGRVLETLSKKDLEKHLSISRKFHQISIINGINLLKIFRFDRQFLGEKRRQCEFSNTDPVIWTNQRWIKWARSIDLSEYAENLKDSGVHGALVVLEHSFSAETMATALGIPNSKGIIRRHLTTEFESLIIPARRHMEEQARFAKLEKRRQEKLGSGGSLGRSFMRSYATLDKREKDKNRSSLRGSLSKALGLKIRDEGIYENGIQSQRSTSTYFSPRAPISNGQNNHNIFERRSESREAIYQNLNRVDGRPLSAIQGFHGSHGVGHERPRSSVVPSSVAAFVQRENHRRVRSIGDIEHITVTPV